MGKYQVILTKIAERQFKEHLKGGDQATLKKLETIYQELLKNPTTGVGQPEMLKYNLSGFWSRRINRKDRLIYKIEEETVTVYIVSAKGHYGDR